MADRTIDAGTDVVRLEVVDGIGLITLNRPDRRNALHHEMYAPMRAAIEEFNTADDVGCIVLTGEGSGFCAGGDVRDGRVREPGAPRPTIEEAGASLLADAQVARMLHESPKLTIAAVNGPAVGAGLSLALSCDLRIMARSATFIPGWGKLAFSGDFGGTWFLTRLVGPSKALELLVLNTKVTADEALALGLANRVVDDAEFPAAWREWADRFATGPRDAVALMKQNVQQALIEPLSTALAAESLRMATSARTQDHKEAVRAWMDKREPDFRRGG
ncbi:MAG: enoyl-CoA hydratase-related protein [Actinomycetota bacterium]|nr:enoyl-CoA hydratase-related protein [Actinomycetota bacterium]